ncbi:hypothetical protein PPSIR1_36052 [Plesiocystis pacifica SIR-1]|uniref:EF-hand domain-containing protein n=1 Tax=Plesiocystis pacifica SIR-1 TaxID=391625 RepID=A6G1Y9_9BACT|nr:EF-hand domain-containing protein [Plesiocystis pacifica]EDM80179.1 hypothetical protein PPSIR1_36052 [Plesiocystis pacifica SIR-1]
MSDRESSPEVQKILADALAHLRAKGDAALSTFERERVAEQAAGGDLEAATAAALRAKIDGQLGRLAKSFDRFDLDGDGVVTVDEVQQILGMGRTDAEGFVSQFDRDGDEQVDYGEFLIASFIRLGFLPPRDP